MKRNEDTIGPSEILGPFEAAVIGSVQVQFVPLLPKVFRIGTEEWQGKEYFCLRTINPEEDLGQGIGLGWMLPCLSNWHHTVRDLLP